MYSLLFKLPENHRFSRNLREHLAPDADGKKTMTWNDSIGLASSTFYCEVGGRTMKTYMDANLDERTGTFKVSLSLEPKLCLRDVFNLLRGQAAPWQASRHEFLAEEATLDEAVALLKGFEERCAASNLPYKNGPLDVNNHYSFLKEMQYNGRAPDAPQPAKFKSPADVIKTLRP